MGVDVVAQPDGNTRSRIDSVNAGLIAAPHADSRRNAALDRPSEGKRTVGEEIAAVQSDHADLEVSVEAEVELHRPAVEAVFRGQGECLGSRIPSRFPAKPTARCPNPIWAG